jgi:sulfatase maturation enzyme AslB (radical SAM superfamily)
MKFGQLAFIVTDDCNFRCSYCPQIKEKIYLERSTIDKAIEFFYPFLEKEAYIIFFGGEPLLAFDTVEYIVACFRKKYKEEDKKLRFSITTNGSLLTNYMLKFFDRHRFKVIVSFDGLAQDTGRKAGTMKPLLQVTRQLAKGRYPGITFSTLSVFSPVTVVQLSESIRAIAETGVTDIGLDIADNMPWKKRDLETLEKELGWLSDFLVAYYKKTGHVPVESFRKAKTESHADSPKTFACVAGRKRIAISPSEDLWGCFVFHPYFKHRQEHQDFHSYSLGKLDDFIKDHEAVYRRAMFYYDALIQDYFFTDRQHCFLCEEVNSCRVCPVNAAYTTSSIGKISPWVCKLNRLQKKERKRFLQKLEQMATKPAAKIVGTNSVRP